MVFEVSYLDPSAPGAVDDNQPPRIDAINVSLPIAAASVAAPSALSFRIQAKVSDNQGGPLDVSATYTTDGLDLDHVQLNATGGLFQATVDAPSRRPQHRR